MTLENTVIRNLSEWRPAERDTLLVPASDSPWTVQVTADSCERLAAQVWELAVRRTTPATLPVADWAQRVAERTAGLIEPLHVVEVDAPAQQALLRSQTPVRRDGMVAYYEVVLKGAGSAVLRRYEAAETVGSRREQAPFILTHDVVGRLAGALASQD